jgi:hypothetical protein
MAFSNVTVAQMGHQFQTLGPKNDPDVAVFYLTLNEATPIYLSEDVYPILSDTPGLPR